MGAKNGHRGRQIFWRTDGSMEKIRAIVKRTDEQWDKAGGGDGDIVS